MIDKSIPMPYDVISLDPGARLPAADRQRDMRKTSAWIKMLRALEEAKKHRGHDQPVR